MANLSVTIKDIVAGDDYDIVRDISNVPASQSLTDAWLTIREDFWSPTSILSKSITTVNSASQGHITDNGADGTGAVRFTLTKDDTILLNPYFEYVYDIQVKTSAGKIYTPESGKIVTAHSVTSSV